jgi:hypothetical protein
VDRVVAAARELEGSQVVADQSLQPQQNVDILLRVVRILQAALDVQFSENEEVTADFNELQVRWPSRLRPPISGHEPSAYAASGSAEWPRALECCGVCAGVLIALCGACGPQNNEVRRLKEENNRLRELRDREEATGDVGELRKRNEVGRWVASATFRRAVAVRQPL